MNHQTGDMVLGGDGLPPLPDTPEALPSATPYQQSHQNIFPGGPMAMPPAMYGIPRFELVARRRKDGTYINVEMVTILTPGDPKAQPRHKVNDHIREKYRPYYELWRRGVESAPQGTPLEMFPMITPAEIAVLKINNIFTVEQLVTMADANDHRIPMARTLKNKATIWLQAKKEADSIERDAAEREVLKSSVVALERQNAMLVEQLERVLRKTGLDVEDEEEPKGRGRKG